MCIRKVAFTRIQRKFRGSRFFFLTAAVDDPAHGARIFGKVVAQVQVVEVLKYVSRDSPNRSLRHHCKNGVSELEGVWVTGCSDVGEGRESVGG